MNKRDIFLGKTRINAAEAGVDGGFEEIKGEKFYKISNYHHMPDFFMSIVSDSDHWMFISSNGSLTAGRKNRDNALFPYYSVDKIHDLYGKVGSNTIVLLEKKNKTFLWEPFSKSLNAIYKVERNLYKSIYGNKILFEEINLDLGIKFSYSWSNSNRYGFVKKSEIENLSNSEVKLEILDGIKNILPYGIDYTFQNEFSNLLDAYKKNELQAETSLGIYSLSSIPVDRAEPSESLKSTTVWSHGIANPTILVSDNQVDTFRRGEKVTNEKDVRAAKGAYYLITEIDLRPEAHKEWFFVAEINQDSKAVADLHTLLERKESLAESVISDIEEGTLNLVKLVASADGLQNSRDDLSSARHFSNTLYNIMRGGIYLNNYRIETPDFRKFIHISNQNLSKNLDAIFSNLPKEISIKDLIQLANETGNSSFLRLCYEYLPLTFSRRHGDPSRPWNLFSIDTKDGDGNPKYDFQGNWRDIFQNWEALSVSYPEFIENIICKFVNASTADGYNPYRIMRKGIEWELPDPDDPWAYIGYWGDHQIIYLQKLLEISNNYHPGRIDQLLAKDIFAYANVPYRIKSYQDILENPQDTILFEAELNSEIEDIVGEIGSDGRLIFSAHKEVYHVNFAEKILVSLLSKLGNFIPEAGIWLNTQRPEWNDANNALVGSGVSMVTLYYLRRFLKFWNTIFTNTKIAELFISEEVIELMESIQALFAENTGVLSKGFTDEERLMFADNLGAAGTKYRNKIYSKSFSGKRKSVSSTYLMDFTALTLQYIDQSIRVNRRDDGLYHAYNLISFSKRGLSVRHLYEMLEGQVSVLSSGYLSTEESIHLLESLRASALYRNDQYSYILYPDRDLPRFLDKNNIPSPAIKKSVLLTKLLEDKDTSIVDIDLLGNCHFNGDFRNVDILAKALHDLKAGDYKQLVEEESEYILDVYESMFDHKSFTGRSGTFFGYEGLGSIYWHMVSKLLLAVQECFFKAVDEKADSTKVGKLADRYYEIEAGLGLHKSPKLYGAFPTDAYSHTPSHAGAKQPGMTGQVKEDVMSRMLELGVRINEGEITFDTSLLNREELLEQDNIFRFYSIDGDLIERELKINQLGFTLCQVLIIYSLAEKNTINIIYKNGENELIKGNAIGREKSSFIFNRTGKIELIVVSIAR